jgi:pre-mRNA-splicing factor CWC26
MSKFDRKTSTGHTAGIHSAASFGEAERSLKRQRDADMAEFNSKSGGSEQVAETVYRDKKGKKLDMLSEFMKQQSTTEGKKQIVEQAQIEWGVGSVQKKAMEQTKQELLEIASEPFARTVDNPKLERMRKEALRDGDPMAQYFSAKKEKEQEQRYAEEDAEEERREKEQQAGSSSKSSVYGVGRSSTSTRSRKPPYKGPEPAPNRFGIRPGYRWDAVDRSSESRFEHRVMLKMNERGSLKDDAYKWSVSDL